MQFYQRHVFVCCNKRENKSACGDIGAQELTLQIKKELSAAGLHGYEKIRISTAGCLGRCSVGPVLVIYPEGRWYTYNNAEDLREIVQQDLGLGNVVSRLLLPNYINKASN